MAVKIGIFDLFTHNKAIAIRLLEQLISAPSILIGTRHFPRPVNINQEGVEDNLVEDNPDPG